MNGMNEQELQKKKKKIETNTHDRQQSKKERKKKYKKDILFHMMKTISNLERISFKFIFTIVKMVDEMMMTHIHTHTHTQPHSLHKAYKNNTYAVRRIFKR